ncbi:MAG: outer rane channel protein [Lacunisphaera sp.]|nr:outer rane channel protein [Lacunisphaera sp.]MDB6166360.1 outer rane channel protein [Lacunisphaera sp.]
MKFRRFLAALPLLAVGAWAAAPGVDDLLLPEKIYPQLDAVLKQAVQQSPQMINRALDLEIAENNRIGARAGLLPSVGGSYTYSKASDDRADLNDRVKATKIYYSLAVTQPIFYWGERRNSARMGEIQKLISAGNQREGYRLFAQEIRTQYLQLIIRRIALGRSRLANKYNQDALKAAEDRFNKKVISEAEVFGVRLSAERAQIDEERLSYDFEAAKQSFARVTGMGQFDEVSLPDQIMELRYSAPAFDEVLAGFLAQKDPPTIAAVNMRSQLEIENLNYANARTRLKPKFNLTAGMTQDEQSYTLNVAQKYRVNSIYGGVSMYWTIFDGFAAQSATRNALARRRQLENDYRGLTDQLARTAQAQVKQLNFSARVMSIYDRTLVATDGSFQVKKTEFARGALSENDVTQANLGYYDALINAENYRADYLVKVGEFLGTVAEDPVLANVSFGK